MLYKLYLYKPEKAARNEWVEAAVGKALKGCFDADTAGHLLRFDAADIKARLEEKLGDKCKVFVRSATAQYEAKEYIYIATSYALAREVLSLAYAVALENDLTLYDGETGKSFSGSPFDDAFITLRLREQELMRRITDAVGPVYRFRKIPFDKRDLDRSVCWCVTLRKDREQAFIVRVRRFYDCISGSLLDDEKLNCENGTFTLDGGGYSLSFCLEGYKKHANMYGYYENGEPKQALLRRMSVEESLRWMKDCDENEKNDIIKRMRFLEMECMYPNPADRLVNSVMKTKRQRK